MRIRWIELPLYPRDPALRARALLIEELADTTLNGFVVAVRWASIAWTRPVAST